MKASSPSNKGRSALYNKRNFPVHLEKINQFDGNLLYGAKKFHSETNRTGVGKPSSGGLTREQSRVVRDTEVERYQRIEEFWEPVTACTVCGKPENSYFLTRYGIDVYECHNCSHRYMNPRVKFDKACELYADDKTSADIYTQPIQKDIDSVKYNFGLELVEKFTDKRKKIMDIGCGTGFFLDCADKRGWKHCVGVDINERYQSVYSDIPGVQFINAPFENLTTDVVGEGYDCIAMWGVLEHLYDLSGTVKKVRALLNKGGILFVLVPNVESLATRIIRDRSATFMWKHVSHFSPDSLIYLMEKIGEFETIHMETTISEIDNVKSYLSGKPPYFGYGDPAGIFDFITPEYIHENLLGSRLIGIFRK